MLVERIDVPGAELLLYPEYLSPGDSAEVMERLQAEIGKPEGFLAQPDPFTAEPLKFKKGTEALVERQKALQAAEEEWLTLAEKEEEDG